MKKINVLIMLLILIMAACETQNIDPAPVTDPPIETDSTRSAVSTTDPQNKAIDIAKNKVIKITFTEEMDASTINAFTFTLKKGTTEVEGTVAYSAKVATFTPSADMDAHLEYKAMISMEAKGVDGQNLASATEWSFTTGEEAQEPLAVVELGAAGNYVILAKTAINNNPTSSITGDMGISPAATSYITGFSLTDATGYATSAQVTGKVYGADMADPTPINLTTAVENMITAYNDAASRPSPDFTELGTGNIGGRTLSAGLYKWSNTVSIPTDLTISGGPNEVWIFQIAGDLAVSSAVNITLSGGAQAKNIFWQVGGEVTLGTTSGFKGIILSMTGVTLGTGATHEGRILAQTAVILDGNAVTQP
ncbi:ice-binding family protein [Nafulsella turpanensis]|uniref:ice-binding family protein n=1 Tax=Nafulsella turpanensis TaxID=1265690 RepID=UPI001F26F1EC|nr:ice-binding family protein [Nafulsella turpanensis]